MELQVNLPKLKSYIEKMPSFPTTVTKVMEICNDSKTSPTDLNKIIRLDPVLMGKILQLINSAYYGISEEITSLVRAIIMLGMNTVKNLALSTAVLGALTQNNNSTGLNMDEFWIHSLGVGVISKLITIKRNINRSQLEEYFVAGLLHDIGKIPLNSEFCDEYNRAMEHAHNEQHPLYVSEKESLAINHTEVGRLIAQNWGLGTGIIDTISYHHLPNEYNGDNQDILYTISVANYFTNILETGFSGDRYPESIDPKFYQQLNIPSEYHKNIAEEVNDEIEKAQIFLEVSR